MVIARRTITHNVTHDDLATTLYPDLNKPPVLATARLLQWCELAAMEELGSCSVSTNASLTQVAPAVLGTRVTVSAVCTNMTGSRSIWYVTACADTELIARVTLQFVLIDAQRYTAQQVAPKAQLAPV
jgi:predicted thioesterase